MGTTVSHRQLLAEQELRDLDRQLAGLLDEPWRLKGLWFEDAPQPSAHPEMITLSTAGPISFRVDSVNPLDLLVTKG